MTIVYDLWFEREYPDREETTLHIGICASESDAAKAIEPIKDQPGFKDYPQGFNIYPRTLGVTGWPEGFVTVTTPAKDGEASDRR